MPQPPLLYDHIPFCRSPCFYCRCNRIISRDVGAAARYLERLSREIAFIAPLFDPAREAHLGGGTQELGELKPLAEDGLVGMDEHSIRATERGRYLLRVIATCFDSYLAPPRPVDRLVPGSDAPALFSRVR